MGHYLKVMGAALLCFSAVVGAGFFAYVESGPGGSAPAGTYEMPPAAEAALTEADRRDLKVLAEKTGRINILLMGSDGGRSDTMMVVSMDPKTGLADLLSVPRDTYHPVPGHTAVGAQKLNAVYGFKGSDGGPEGVRRQVAALLGIPVHYYVNIDYQGVREVVDILGGVPVEIPFRMVYDDVYDDPPLHIRFEPGPRLLSGDDAVKYLRWRKNNGEEGAGDLGRIQRQQDFMRTALKKALGLKLPGVIQASFRHLRTDMPVDRMLRYGAALAGFDPEGLQVQVIPGEVQTVDGLSVYVHDPAATEALLLALYNRTAPEPSADTAALETAPSP